MKTLVVRSPSMKMILQHWPVQHSCSIWLQFVPSVKAFLKKNKRISLGFTKNRANSYSTSLRWDDQEIINLSDSIAPEGRNLHKPVSLFTHNMLSMSSLGKHVQQTSNTRLPCNYRSETAFNLNDKYLGLPCQARVSPHPLRRERAQGRQRGSTRSVKFYWNTETLVSVRHGRKWYIYCSHVDYFNKPRTDNHVCVDSQRVNPRVRL